MGKVLSGELSCPYDRSCCLAGDLQKLHMYITFPYFIGMLEVETLVDKKFHVLQSSR